MTFPLGAERVAQGLATYREARRAAGHPGQGRVMIAFHMFCAPTRAEAYEAAREHVDGYFAIQVDAASDWETVTSVDYPDRRRMPEKIREATFDSKVADFWVWAGSPTDLRDVIAHYDSAVGGFDRASLQVNFHTPPVEAAEASMRLFAREVMPAFANRGAKG